VSLHVEKGTFLHIPMKLHRRGGRKLIITPDANVIRSPRRKPDPVIIRALALSRRRPRVRVPSLPPINPRKYLYI